jgi:UDP-glucose 4-epimerase
VLARNGRDRRVLVTGAAGFIGQNLSKRLIESGFEVHATSRFVRRDDSSSVHWWQAELASADAAKTVFSEVKPDIVFHLSGRAGAEPDINLVLPAYHSLATSTVNVLANATEHGCERIVLFASCNEPAASDPDCVPASPYAAGKWVGTVYGRMFHKLYASPVVTLRPFMTYGPGQAREKLVPFVATSLASDRQPLLTSCRTRGDWVYIDDVVEACMAAISAPTIEGREFDVGTGELMSQRLLVETLVKVSGRNITPAFGAIPDRPHEHEVAANIEPTMNALGWKANTSVEDGLLKTWNWYRDALASVR